MFVIMQMIRVCMYVIKSVLRSLEHDSHLAIEWFESNYMKLNEDKCNFLISGKKNRTFMD